jgi:hypothetical protein
MIRRPFMGEICMGQEWYYELARRRITTEGNVMDDPTPVSEGTQQT